MLGLRQIPTLNPHTWPLAFVQVIIMLPAHVNLVLLSATVQMLMKHSAGAFSFVQVIVMLPALVNYS